MLELDQLLRADEVFKVFANGTGDRVAVLYRVLVELGALLQRFLHFLLDAGVVESCAARLLNVDAVLADGLLLGFGEVVHGARLLFLEGLVRV